VFGALRCGVLGSGVVFCFCGFCFSLAKFFTARLCERQDAIYFCFWTRSRMRRATLVFIAMLLSTHCAYGFTVLVRSAYVCTPGPLRRAPHACCKAVDGRLTNRTSSPPQQDPPSTVPSSPQDLPSLGESLQGSLLRVLGSTGLGAAGGSAAHAWLLPAVSVAWLDTVINAFNVLSGTALGATLGVLWAIELALVSTGIISAAFQQSFRLVVDDERDEMAGARALEVIRETLERLRNLGGLRGFLLGSALFVCGMYDDPAIERLAMEATDAQKGAGGCRSRALSELVGLAVESTLLARFFDLKLLVLTVAFLLVGSIDGAVYYVISRLAI
jgi:hypothetical protein